MQIFKVRFLVYFCTDCYELSQFIFHLLLQDTRTFEVCFMVSVLIKPFFSEIYVRLFLDNQNLLDGDSAIRSD